MAKKKQRLQQCQPEQQYQPEQQCQPDMPQHSVETGRGEIKHNHLAALVTSKVFRAQVVKAKKGKGAYQRKMKHKGREAFEMRAVQCLFQSPLAA